ncbi:MAG: S41 family peptidase [Chloroflexi bacterium]|nr:S41 family peptidase [Chloroflexota bacterium]
MNNPQADRPKRRLSARLALSLTLLVFFLFTFSAGFLTSSLLRATTTTQAAGTVDFKLLQESFNLVQDKFVYRDQVDERKMLYGSIVGMLDTLGDEGHTRFLTPEQLKAEKQSLEGRLEGIGAEVAMKDGRPTIVAPLEGSPAERAGIKAGDVVLAVNGEETTHLTLTDTVNRIRGTAGTEVTVQIYRPATRETIDLKITRAQVKVRSASWTMLPGSTIGFVRLSSFSENAESDIKEAVNRLKGQGATGIIVDMRDNPGGLLEQAVRVTSQFLTKGNVVVQADAKGNRKPYGVRAGGIATDIPVAVLANGGSASSAEIFAGAMQDHQRGPVIGEKTFGTGTVLGMYHLSDGSAILLGTDQWLTPAGREIRKHGVKPDLEVKLEPTVPRLSPRAAGLLSSEELRQHTDLQVLSALHYLETGSLEVFKPVEPAKAPAE